MVEALSRAKGYAWAPVSGFQVGAVAMGASGRFHLGANLEVAGLPLAHTVHAEQAAVHRAWCAGETGISEVVVTATPCGHCRQFLWELDGADQLQIRVDEQSISLGSLLPRPFGPANLDVDRGLLAHAPKSLVFAEADATSTVDDDELVAATASAASLSYSPYTHAASAVGLRTSDGGIHIGRYAENAAFNPSLQPMLTALSSLRLAGRDPSSVERAILVERTDAARRVAQRAISELVWCSLSEVPLEVLPVRASSP